MILESELAQGNAVRDARACVLAIPDGGRRRRVFFHSWTVKGRQPGLSFAVPAAEGAHGLELSLAGFAEGPERPE